MERFMKDKDWLQRLLQRKIDKESERYDEVEAMLTVRQENWKGGYHTRKTGILHPLRDAAEYADAIFQAGRTDLFERGEQVIQKVCHLQDDRPDSRTFGLWSYYMEEPLDSMIAPDYNWADFISKCLLGIRILAGERVSEETKGMMDQSIMRAALCSIKRNVGLDYTNIALMSSMTILSAGELLKDCAILQAGKERLEKLYRYTEFNGSFSEYNSSAYILVALNEIARMRKFFHDPACLAMAEAFNGYAWDCLSNHYNPWINQLAPPQARAYTDLDKGALAWNVFLGTGGRFGRIPGGIAAASDPHWPEQVPLDQISVESLLYPPKCPDVYLSRFTEKRRFLAHTYYKKNGLREAGTDTTIIRDLDHPDLTAYSFLTEKYSMGIFEASDCWNQRRNGMVVWGQEKPAYMRIRGLIGDYDFCSAMVYGVQADNRIAGHLGLVSDRGSFHYILDKQKDGVYETDRLCFCFELGGREDLAFEKDGGSYVIRDKELTIKVKIYQFVFDGKPVDAHISDDGKRLYLTGYEGEKKLLDIKQLEKTYGVFSIEVLENCGKEDGRCGGTSEVQVETRLDNEILHSEGTFGQSAWTLESPVSAVPFLEASRICSAGSGLKDKTKL